MIFKTALVDELGLVQFWCDELDDEEIADLLEEFPEWSEKAIQICQSELLFIFGGASTTPRRRILKMQQIAQNFRTIFVQNYLLTFSRNDVILCM